MVFLSQNTAEHLETLLSDIHYDKLFVLSDEHTQNCCVKTLSCPAIQQAEHLMVASGEEAKSMETAINLWRQLNEASATRQSLLLCVGGGMITDLGGFVASTFKRGMRCFHVSTTLLGAVDAATGGKTAVNFDGYKNLIGLFYKPEHVVVAIDLFSTLDHSQLLSGYAEMLKHALISSPHDWNITQAWDVETMPMEPLKTILERNIAIKQSIVEKDPTEQGERKKLNFGHTIGHAIESWTHEVNQPRPHGYAVMWGMVAEAFISHQKLAFPSHHVQELVSIMKRYYGTPEFTCKHYDTLCKYMLHDKKNMDATHINFTLLKQVGEALINQTATKKEIYEALDFLREC